MATADIYPSSDVTADWDTTTGATHWDEINEDPASPTDASYIETTTDGDVDEFGMTDAPANTSQVTQIDVTLRARLTDPGESAASIQCDLFHSAGTPVTGNPKTYVGADFGGYGVLGNASKSWTTLTLTRTQANTLQKRITFNN